MSKTYPIEFSPLYRMRNRRKLARVLKLDEKYFKQNHTYKYNHFSEPKPNDTGTRNFTVQYFDNILLYIQNNYTLPLSQEYFPEAVRHQDQKFS